MEHYIVIAKSYNINQAGDATMDAADVLAVKHTEVEARNFIEALQKEYEQDDYRVDNEESQSTDGSILVMPNDQDPGYYIHIYFELRN